VRQKDSGHAAASKLALDRVAIVESLAERRRDVGQGVPPVLRDSPNLYGLSLKG